MLILGTLCALAALAVTLRWWIRRYDALGRPRRFPVISIGLLVALCVAAVVPTYLRHREQDRLSAVATQLVGAPAVVHCQTIGQELVQLGSELGYVKWGPDGVPEHQTTIMRGPCGALREYMRSNKERPSPNEVIAVHILTHESMHMRGIKDEAAAECAAMQRDATTAKLLGADETAAMKLARAYWVADYPFMPDGYRSSACAPDGSLDEHLPTPPWRPRT